MRIDEFLEFVLRIKLCRDPEEAFKLYAEKYLEISYLLATKLVENSGVEIAPETRQKFFEYAKRLFLTRVWDVRFIREQTVIYPPNIKYVYVVAFGTRNPLMRWQSIPREDKAERLREACSLLGPALNVAIRGCGRILLLDIDLDYTHPEYKKVFEAVESVLMKFDLPFCLTWHGGFNVFIPIDEDKFKKGVKLHVEATVKDLTGAEMTYSSDFLYSCSLSIVLGTDKAQPTKETRCIGLVEIKCDGVYTWPPQSRLWWEVDLARDKDMAEKIKRITNVTFVEKKFNEKHPPSVNWFRHGIPLIVDDPEHVLKKLIEELANATGGAVYAVVGRKEKKFDRVGIRLENVRPALNVELKVVEREHSVEEVARGAGEEGFREYLFRANVPYDGADLPVASRFHHVRDVTTVFDAFTGEEMLRVTKLLAAKKLIPECLRYFVLDPPPAPVCKFYLNIVAWFLARHLFPLFFFPNEVQNIDKWRSRVRPFVEQASRIKKLPLVWYYYEKFNSVGRPASDVFLKEAHNYLILTEVCANCLYKDICYNDKKSASAKLLEVVNRIAYLSHRDRDLRNYLSRTVIERILAGQKPLPRLLDEAWILKKLTTSSSQGSPQLASEASYSS